MAIANSQISSEPPCCGRPQVRAIVAWALAPLSLMGCLGAEKGGSDAAATYQCEDGTFFSAEFFGRSARVTTLGNSYLLERRPSSIGRKYSAGTVVFIQDEDRGVLVGAADGPYRRCAEAGSGQASSR